MIKRDIPKLDLSLVVDKIINSHQCKTFEDNFSNFSKVEVITKITETGNLFHTKLSNSEFQYVILNKSFFHSDNESYMKLYEKKFAVKLSKNVNYRSIMLNNNSSITCYYCGISEAVELDHYFEKTNFSMLSIVPNNLVPCCTTCNKIKKDINKTNQIIYHPYYHSYDLIGDFNISIKEFKSVIFLDIKLRDSGVSNVTYNTVESLDLENRYKVAMNNLMSEIKETIHLLSITGEKSDINEYLLKKFSTDLSNRSEFEVYLKRFLATEEFVDKIINSYSNIY